MSTFTTTTQMTEVRDRWVPRFRPNGLQAAADGLWVVAQSGGEDTDTHAYKLSYENGSVIRKIPTRLEHAGGISESVGYLWITSGYDLTKLDYDGNEVATFLTPEGRGAHGVEWIDEHNMWLTSPGTFRVYLIDPSTMEVKHSVPFPVGKKGHGMFVRNGSVWQGVTRKDTGGGEIYELNARDGRVLTRIDVAEPEIHGMTLHDGLIWICCAKSDRVCTIPMPA
jgi:streptogramin lyase